MTPTWHKKMFSYSTTWMKRYTCINLLVLSTDLLQILFLAYVSIFMLQIMFLMKWYTWHFSLCLSMWDSNRVFTIIFQLCHPFNFWYHILQANHWHSIFCIFYFGPWVGTPFSHHLCKLRKIRSISLTVLIYMGYTPTF